MVERRKHKRVRSPQLLPIIDVNSNEQLGKLADLSYGGLLMITTSYLPVDNIYQLQIDLPQHVGASNKIEFAAEVAWSESPEANEACWAGFHIIDISDYELEQIGRLIDQWSLAQNNLVIND
jgi:c-di-GMP-binding flagellar brake protein YcgR